MSYINVHHILISKGDVSANYFSVSDFTTDGTWRDLDLSSIVPTGTVWVLLKIGLKANAAPKYAKFRKNGYSNEINIITTNTQVANQYIEYQEWVEVDADRIIEYNIGAATWANIDILVVGYMY